MPSIATKTYDIIPHAAVSLTYKLRLVNAKAGRYIVSAVLNNGWCKGSAGNSSDWLRSGDYYNAEVNEYVLKTTDVFVTKDMTLTQVQQKTPERGVCLTF